eukprot:scaffold6942_cov63-Cyclotella_meneghiniana.AAC.1
MFSCDFGGTELRCNFQRDAVNGRFRWYFLERRWYFRRDDVSTVDLSDVFSQNGRYFSIEYLPNQPTTTSPTGQPASLTCYNARKIRLEATTGAPLQIFELGALSSNVNVALQGTATQSSDFRSKYVASKAIDGNDNTFSHTKYFNAWIEVDLGDSHLIDEVVIKNRWCRNENDGPECLCRLSSAKMLLLDANDSIIAEKNLGDTCGVLTVTESYTSDAG